MISVGSIWAVTLRHMRLCKRDINFILFGLYWPVLDVFIWGFVGSWIAQSQSTQFQNYQLTALCGLLLWQVVGRGCNFMLTSFTEELFSNNLVNLFSLPLCTSEWMCGITLFTAIMIAATSLFCMIVISALYTVPLWSLASVFLLFLPPLFFSCIWVGFTCLQVLINWGKKGIEAGYVLIWILLPFSGAYYPIEVLPAWGQRISAYVPMSYVFQGMRGYLMHTQDPTPYLIKGYILSILYAFAAILFFVYCFNRSKQKGLARLAD